MADSKKQAGLETRNHKVFLLPEANRVHVEPILEALRVIGVTEFNHDLRNKTSWSSAQFTKDFDLLWSNENTHFSSLGVLNARHKVNHLPGNEVLVSKPDLYNGHQSFQKKHGKFHFNFMPEQFIYPEQKREFLKALEDQKTTEILLDRKKIDPSYKRRWLVKNRAQRGVHYFTSSENVEAIMPHNAMVQRLIEPLLISRHKFEIGLYTLVTSLDPLRIYVYDNALLRFCREPYPAILSENTPLAAFVVDDDYLPPWNIKDIAPFYAERPSATSDGTNHLQVVLKYLEVHAGIDSDRVHRELMGAIVKMIAANREQLQRGEANWRRASRGNNYTENNDNLQDEVVNNFFELWRFDFILDDAGKPWLIEVNSSPSLASKSTTLGTSSDVSTDDAAMKHHIALDLVQLIGITAPADPRPASMVIKPSLMYCQEKCLQNPRYWDMTCWRCPSWFPPVVVDSLYSSSMEHARRGRFNLVFPSVKEHYATFLPKGLSIHDLAFAKYLNSFPQVSNMDEVAILCVNRDQCSRRGDCINGHCKCDVGFEGKTCFIPITRDATKQLTRLPTPGAQLREEGTQMVFDDVERVSSFISIVSLAMVAYAMYRVAFKYLHATRALDEKQN